MAPSVIRTAEPWTPWSILWGIVLALALLALVVWLIRRASRL